MANETIIRSAINQFRRKFVIPTNRVSGNAINRWFPGHMYGSMKVMQAKLRDLDCIIEVHDSRIPFSGRNEEFRKLLYSIRPHVLVMNKCDLIDTNLRPRIEDRLRQRDPHLSHIIWTNCLQKKQDAIKTLMNVVNRSLEQTRRFNREERTDYSIMVIGIPNVGKSSLINAIRRISAGLTPTAKVGAMPGVTRAVQEKVRIQASPLIYMLDTPGIVAPHIRDVDVGMKMVLCDTVLQHLVGYDLIADYLLYWMNKRGDYRYLQLTNLAEPLDDIRKLLFEIAFKNKLTRNQKMDGEDRTTIDLEGASKMFLNHFRSGKFGCQFLDGDILECT